MAAVEDLEDVTQNRRQKQLKAIAKSIEADIMRLQYPANCSSAKQVH